MKLIRLVITGLFIVSAGACSKSSTQSVNLSTVAATDASQSLMISNKPVEKTVALIMKTLTNPFFVEMEKGARMAEHETGINLQVKTATQETSIDQQIGLVEKQIAANVNAIVIAPGDSERLIPVLKKAQDAGIKVINIDNRLNPESVAASGMRPIPFISIDNDKAAYLSAKFVADRIKQPGEAAIFEGIRSADNANQRKHGAERAFNENSNLRIVAMETANWKIDEAYEVAKRVFKKHPKIAVVFCANDMMAIGVIKYLQESGKTTVLVAGFDALEEAKTAIRAGQMSATIDQQARKQGYEGVMTALKAIRGETVPDVVLVDAGLLTADTLR
jgi:ribose transport system substrate-binding protein